MGHNLEAPAGRCVFSETLNGQTLGTDAGDPPGAFIATGGIEPDRVNGWRAVAHVLRSPLGLARTLAGDVLTTLFPANCRSCDGPLERAVMIPVCDRCLDLTHLPAPFASCWQCGEALDASLDLEDSRYATQMARQLRCRECRLAPPAFDRAVSCAAYDRELRTLIQLFKFDALPALARPLGDVLGHRLATCLADATLPLEPAAMLVIAVPLFKSRQRQRGYNQSVLLADRAVKRLRRLQPAWQLTPAHSLLKRVRRTEAQYLLSQRERRINLRGAFLVTGDVRGRSILLVDDIMTSGATARECARALKTAGAATVHVATLARAQRQEFARLHQDPGDEHSAHLTPASQVAAWDAPAATA